MIKLVHIVAYSQCLPCANISSLLTADDPLTNVLEYPAVVNIVYAKHLY